MASTRTAILPSTRRRYGDTRLRQPNQERGGCTTSRAKSSSPDKPFDLGQGRRRGGRSVGLSVGRSVCCAAAGRADLGCATCGRHPPVSSELVLLFYSPVRYHPLHAKSKPVLPFLGKFTTGSTNTKTNHHTTTNHDNETSLTTTLSPTDAAIHGPETHQRQREATFRLK